MNIRQGSGRKGAAFLSAAHFCINSWGLFEFGYVPKSFADDDPQWGYLTVRLPAEGTQNTQKAQNTQKLPSSL